MILTAGLSNLVTRPERSHSSTIGSKLLVVRCSFGRLVLLALERLFFRLAQHSHGPIRQARAEAVDRRHSAIRQARAEATRNDEMIGRAEGRTRHRQVRPVPYSGT